ncbi:hypothetical protein WJX74_002157 [Apatococcus lobatus]|uniref:protein-tyrosine-phosphatase n=1 Tax=Apatococcus lobatus TaxID=904363 RepID=A0AAW1QJF5_9CHLO
MYQELPLGRLVPHTGKKCRSIHLRPQSGRQNTAARHRQHYHSGICQAASGSAQAQQSSKANTPDEDLGDQQVYDPMRATVQPVFRSTPREGTEGEEAQSHGRLLFVSESNVCRSVLAEAFLRRMISTAGLAEKVSIESKACRDYNIGDPPDPAVLRAAAEIGLNLQDGKVAELFDPSRDIGVYDMVLVMDKFTASDVLREVSIFDTIHKENSYTSKVRRLGEFHPGLIEKGASDDQDIADPLYGNTGGPEEQVAVQEVAEVVNQACNGLKNDSSGLILPSALPSEKEANATLPQGVQVADGAQATGFRRKLLESCAAKNSFRDTCTVTSGKDGSCTVCANCQTFGEKTVGSCVDTSSGCADITNVNGKLVCNH